MNITIKYQAHVEEIGWQNYWAEDGAKVGS